MVLHKRAQSIQMVLDAEAVVKQAGSAEINNERTDCMVTMKHP